MNWSLAAIAALSWWEFSHGGSVVGSLFEAGLYPVCFLIGFACGVWARRHGD